MTPKQERLLRLRNLIAENKASNQEDILGMLSTSGVTVTQATLSRDLKELKVAKTPDGNGGYRYRLPDSRFHLQEPSASESAAVHAIDGIASIEFSGQMCVLKTRPGYANMIGSMIDSALPHMTMGTIAGDDTLLLILREGTQAETILRDLEKVIPGITLKNI